MASLHDERQRTDPRKNGPGSDPAGSLPARISFCPSDQKLMSLVSVPVVPTSE